MTDAELESIGIAMIRMPFWSTRRLEALSGFDRPDEVVPVLWEDPDFRRAVRISSPRLAADADWATSTAAVPGKRLRGVGLALLRYAIRMSSRPTPFGAFAAVGTVPTETGSDDAVTTVHSTGFRSRHRIGSGAAQGAVLATEREALEELEVMINPTVHRRSDRLELLVNAAQDRETAHDLLSVRWTPAVEKTLELAAGPIRADALIRALVGDGDGEIRTRVESFVRTLLGRGFLVSSARASLTDSGAVERVAPLEPTGDLRRTVDALDRGELDDAALEDVFRSLRPFVDSETQEMLQVDVAAATEGVVSGRLVDRITAAATALTLLSPAPGRSPELRDYAFAFQERYGRREVPVTELLDELVGLGFPHGYPGSNRPAPPRFDERWEADLAILRRRLTTRAEVVDGIPHSELLDADLTPFRTRGDRPPASLDVFALIGGTDDPDGATIAPVGATTPAGAAFGRFDAILDDVTAVLHGGSELELAAQTDTRFCHVDYLNPRPHMNNVAFAPQQFDTVIPLTSTAHAGTPGALPLADVLVGWADGFHLRSASTGARIIVRNPNILNRVTQPGLVRFLLDVSDDGTAKPGWAWGAHEEHVDVLPRIVHNGITIAPAQWRLPETAGDRDESVAALRTWRTKHGVPRRVYVGVYDNRLLVDLEDDLQTEVLLREHRAGAAWVQEGPETLDSPTVTGPDGQPRLAEIVLPLRRRTVEPHPPLPPRRGSVGTSVPQPSPGADPLAASAARGLRERCAPGVEWWSFRIAGRRKDQDDVLRAMTAAATTAGADFFFVRYSDPEDHVRFRVRATTAPGPVFACAGDLLSSGRVSDVSLRSYDREVERYGGRAVFPRCETLFCRTSLATVGLLAALPGEHDEDGDRTTAGAFVVDAFLQGLGVGAERSSGLLQGMAAGYAMEFAEEGPALRRAVQRARPLRRPALAALMASRESGAPGALVSGPLVTGATALAAAAVHDGPAIVDDVFAAGDDTAFGVLSSLVHMQANRLGFTRQEEYQIVLVLLDGLAARKHRAATEQGGVR
ncbi:thiopeptide-type bacteriocin biosynthesis protein [Curtobacterium flaccumfaciens]|uniref:Thiopeptide-type bacteriocin biosynthesis protein n=1 Tax=Curtobacterium flaccumfaciens TaxID=2035 RepID=A0A4R6DHT1_9MICO|nr:lantibiotic dehydratase [Curtobacterium flaccumfaciens]TDN44261.1 thiopeptide-type bacteriocin biosynthesis protein [Curtobacterium flaccumfaciens]